MMACGFYGLQLTQITGHGGPERLHWTGDLAQPRAKRGGDETDTTGHGAANHRNRVAWGRSSVVDVAEPQTGLPCAGASQVSPLCGQGRVYSGTQRQELAESVADCDAGRTVELAAPHTAPRLFGVFWQAMYTALRRAGAYGFASRQVLNTDVIGSRRPHIYETKVRVAQPMYWAEAPTH